MSELHLYSFFFLDLGHVEEKVAVPVQALDYTLDLESSTGSGRPHNVDDYLSVG